MTLPQRVVFWEPTASPHKYELFYALTELSPEMEVICCAHQALQPERAAMGWSIGENHGFQEYVAPNSDLIRELVAASPETSLHVFSGIRWVPTIEAAIREVRRTGCRFAIMSEPRVREGWQGELRFLHSLLTEGWYRRNCSFVLAIGRNGPPWFRSVMYSEKKIFPFAYFVSADGATEYEPRASAEDIVIGYLGRMVAMKGVDDLLDAMKILGSGYQLILGGEGSERERLRRRVLDEGISCSFAGTIPITSVPQFMRRLDLLVLASRSKDGWGVVVSEALLSGVSVVATTCVGASVLLDKEERGKVVPASSPQALAAAIGELRKDGMLAPGKRVGRAKWAAEHIDSRSGARYFLEILRHVFSGGTRPKNFYMDTQ